MVTITVTTTASAMARDKAQELEIGTMPPPLPTGQWIGDAPDTAGAKTRLLFFWDPSFQGSRIAMPILSRLQQRWGSDRLQVLGYGVEMTPKKYNEDPPKTVEPFVIKQASRIKFPVASVQQSEMSRSWLRKREAPFLLLMLIGPHGALQGIMSPLDEEVNALVAKLVTGRYDVLAEEWAGPYREQIVNYRRSRDWTQYKAVVDILSKGGTAAKTGMGYFVEEELDFVVSALTEQDDPELAGQMVGTWMMERSETDPEFLGMLAERLANDPAIPDDRRMLGQAAEAAKISYESADNAEARARALGRRAIVSSRQGKEILARSQAKQAYRIAPPNIKPELKERWLYVKQHTRSGV
jgi:hypothetical protein